MPTLISLAAIIASSLSLRVGPDAGPGGQADHHSLTPAGSVIPDPRLSVFAGLAGAWGTDDASPMHETWMPARGKNMTGALRWYAEDGSVRMYELMTITAETDAIRLHIRHFDAQMNPWASEADGPMALRLASSEDQRLVFEAEARARSITTITYDMSTPGRALVELAFGSDREPVKIDFARVAD